MCFGGANPILALALGLLDLFFTLAQGILDSLDDAWVFGADDPVSGTVSLMEEARAMGELFKSGSKPRRTIVFAVWDGEEPGLLGSTVQEKV